jgi:L-aminopeptidase/D-esterase-like protein
MRTPSALRRDGLAGVRIGHAASVDGSTGVSVVLFGQAAPTVVDVRGGASGTYDTASLSLDATFGRRWAVFFTGGSVFGLDAGGGVRDAVLGAGGGHAVYRNPNRVAPVSGAVLFDLPARRRRPVDYRTLGHEAAESAVPIAPFAGRVGASSGARIGKYLGRGHSQPGALAIARENDPGFGSVAVLAVLNSVGAVRDPSSGKWIAGARDAHGRLVPPDHRVRSAPAGTTLVAVVTDVAVGRPALQRVAAFAQGGLARAVVPSHTSTDGDTVFVSTVAGPRSPVPARGPAELRVDQLGALAERGTVRAILAAARAANRFRPRSGDGAASRGGPGSGRSS